MEIMMLLLYCQNGVVVANHNDDQNVSADAYGSGTRIIPWPGALGDLTKVGPPLDPALGINVDNRPYGQPTETPAILLHYAAQVRWQTSTQGVAFTASSGTINADTDRISQSLLGNLATYAQTLQPTDTIAFTQNNVAYSITAQDAIDLFNTTLAQVQNARNIEAQCIADLNSPTPAILTYDDVDARFAGLKRGA